MRLGWLAAATLLVAAGCSSAEPDVITLDTTTTLVPISSPSTSVAPATSTSAATTTSIVETTTTTTLPDGVTLTFAEPGTPEAEVEIAVRLAEAAYLEAVSDPPNPNHPGIAATRSSDQAETLRQSIQVLVEEGWAVRRSSSDQFESTIFFIEMVGLDRAEVELCSLDDLVVYDVATGETLNDAVVSKFILHTYERVDGSMKLAEVVVDQESDGVSGCVAVLP